MNDARQPPEPGCFDSLFGGGGQATEKTKALPPRASRYEHKNTKDETSSIVKHQPESITQAGEPNQEINESRETRPSEILESSLGQVEDVSETPNQTIAHQHP